MHRLGTSFLFSLVSGVVASYVNKAVLEKKLKNQQFCTCGSQRHSSCSCSTKKYPLLDRFIDKKVLSTPLALVYEAMRNWKISVKALSKRL